MTLTGVILAGGRNSRMKGANKALLQYEGERFIERQVRVMSTICASIIVVTPDPTIYNGLLTNPILYVPDVYPGCGPLSGMHAAFRIVKTKYAWVVGCDYPAISAMAAQWMLRCAQEGDYDVVLPVAEGNHQMLHAVYRPLVLLPIITERLETGRHRLSGLLESCRWHGVVETDWRQANIPLDFIKDVDTPAQYKSLLRGCEFHLEKKEERIRVRSEI
ncbi:molybdenum cofactor guanylyltransferase [Paenibacillus sp. N3/727]|uniref:molybdenum cofactor guanylyltransferase n=1 Tax=Paenibacillus sp. N3/727 TaxID=2925845 RepID=UPI001F536A0C|nr:molybdenum cofactor guanylyltransferase [Paenibacillus sp. N3/727]UNK16246.1 molybdenum cofactor guanylyltransferase [Paenibacillus sp. N3/727]